MLQSDMTTTMFPLVLSLLCYSLVAVQAQRNYIYNFSPYVSPTTVLLNYEKMVENFKVFVYKPNSAQLKFASTVESLFYSSLHNSTYLTQDPEEAHLFFLPFSSDLSTRALAHVLSRIRNDFPYWNRTLGADHFYLSRVGIPLERDRNLVELKKNAVQISCFPTPNDKFVPHKDITLPPVPDPHVLLQRVPARSLVNDNETWRGEEFLCAMKHTNDASWIGEALRVGCVPVVVTEEPLNDMPFMDVLRWREMAVFVRSVGGVTRALGDTWRERHERMRKLGVAASTHFQWNQPPLPFDAFNTIMYQLWLRRHTVRYAMVQ